MKDHEKTDKIERFLEELLRLIAQHGIDGYKISDLARNAKVSRPWIYKMFGSQKKILAREAALYFGRRFSELEKIDGPSNTRANLIASLQRRSDQLIRDTIRHPYIVTLYFRHMGSTDAIGQVIKETEAAYLQKLTEMLTQVLQLDQKAATQQARLLLTTRMGLVYSWLRNSKLASANDPGIRQDLIYSVERILR